MAAAERGGPTGVPHSGMRRAWPVTWVATRRMCKRSWPRRCCSGTIPERDADRDSGTVGALTTLDVLNDASMDTQIWDAVQLLETSGLGNLLDEARSVSLPDWLPLDEAASKDAAALRRLDMFTRMTFSALVDADYLDTDRHFRAAATPRVAAATDFDMLFDQFQRARSTMLEGLPHRRSGPSASRSTRMRSNSPI